MAESLNGQPRTANLATAAVRILSVAILSVASVSVHAAQSDERLMTIHTGELLGRWGLASFEIPADRVRTESAARGQCRTPYVIRAGKSGGVMMHQADRTIPQELWLKGGPGGRKYIGPRGPTPGEQDREIVWYDGQVMITRFVEKSAATRYGNMVYVRCETGT
ncbi:hypothetical protein [Bradyrhizobium genosp. L]|uniref:hypothetical protein n=1 Tax=Bradyrhizobium genosp. L TaxID=83637 RepID=UPI003D9B2B96